MTRSPAAIPALAADPPASGGPTVVVGAARVVVAAVVVLVPPVCRDCGSLPDLRVATGDSDEPGARGSGWRLASGNRG